MTGQALKSDPGLVILSAAKNPRPRGRRVAITFKKVICGTELNIVQEGVPAVIPPEMCYLGWQESLVQLAQLVEPEIPN